MKILKTSLLALSLLAALPLQAAENRRAGRHRSASGAGAHRGDPQPRIRRQHHAILAGAIQEGRKLGFKVDTFLSNGDDARFRDFVNGLSARNMTASFSRRGEPLFHRVGQTHRGGRHRRRGFRYRRQRQRSRRHRLAAGRRFAGQRLLRPAGEGFQRPANIIKLWVAGFPPMERRQAAYQQLLKQHPGIHELESIGAVSSDVQGDTANKVGAVLAKYPKGKIDAIWGTWTPSPGALTKH